MASKIKILKLIILFFATCLLIFICINKKTNIETDLLRTLIPNVVENQDIFYKVNEKTNSNIKVVFEDDEDAINLKEEFLNKVDKNEFEIIEPDFSLLIKKYSISPTNFLSYKNRTLLKNKKYDEIYNNSMELLYNPVSFHLSDFKADPYLLLDDFILSMSKNQNRIDFKDDKYYDSLLIKIKGQDKDSVDIKKVEKIIKIKDELDSKNSKIYLAGTPIHSYYASKSAKNIINTACILSGFLILFLTYFYFRKIKLIFLVVAAILFGMLSGFCAVKLLCSDFQIITMVFSTTLIGIGIDYSYHYFFKSGEDKEFKRNLTSSFLTTIIPFILLYFTKIELLRQISIFTVFGLLSIFLIVSIYYPLFKHDENIKNIKINTRFCKIILGLALIFPLFGIFNFKINDSLNNLYMPSKNLIKAENLYNEINGIENTQLVTVQGNSFQELLEKEEKISDKLSNDDIKFYSLSNFIPSFKRQKENYNLTMELYKNNLDKFYGLIDKNDIALLKNSKFKPVEFKIDNYPYFKDFMIDKKISLIYVFSDKKLDINEDGTFVLNFRKDIENYLTDYRKTLQNFSIYILFGLFVLISFIYGIKKTIKIVFPSFLGGILALLASLCFNFGLNMFNLIAFYMVLGFTFDYSIFRANKCKNSEDAILTSSLTTGFSFLLLSFSSFKLLSSISTVIFFGILFSYLIGYIIFNKGYQEE